MGASESKPVVVPVKGPETPIKFSDDVLGHLSNTLSNTSPTPERENTLDSHVRTRIREEVARLQAEEAEVKRKIHEALQKDNIDTEARIANNSGGDNAESSSSNASSDTGVVVSSASLREDVEDVRRKVERFQTKRKLVEQDTEVAKSKEALLKCYLGNPDKPLDCWKEVEAFRKNIEALEQRFVNSLR